MELENFIPLKKSAPEFSFYHKVKAFFDGDPDIEVEDIDEENYSFTILLHNAKKYEIMKKALCVPKGARRLTVNIECDEKANKSVSEKDLAYLLENNKYFSEYIGEDYIGEGDKSNGLLPVTTRYIMMQPTVVQYYDDIFNNPCGYDTKTAEQLAKELFHGSHCNITSEVEEAPL